MMHYDPTYSFQRVIGVVAVVKIIDRNLVSLIGDATLTLSRKYVRTG
jgi:hypothetical protein